MAQKPPGMTDRQWRLEQAVEEANDKFKAEGTYLDEPAPWEEHLKKHTENTLGKSQEAGEKTN
jgi:uncharacterized protein YcgL (UPF0745 family)